MWEHKACQKKPFLNGSRTLPAKLDLNSKAIHNNTWLIPVTGVVKDFDTVDCPHQYLGKFQKLWEKLPLPLQKKLILSQSDRNLENLLEKETSIGDQINTAEEFVRSEKDDFFLYLNLVSCHYPYNPPREYKERHGVEKSICDFESRPLEYGGQVIDSEMEDIRKLYNAEVDYLDDKFGEFIQTLKDENIYEESMIVVFSDHGEMLGENEKFGHHLSTHKNLIEMPLMIKHSEKSKEEVNKFTELREVHHKIIEEFNGEKFSFSDKAYGIYEKPVIYGRDKPTIKPIYYKVSGEGIRREEKSIGDISG